MSESMNFSVLKHHPSTYGPQLRAKVHSLPKLEFEVLLRNPSSPKNQNTTTKAKKTALQHQRHNTKLSPTHHQNITAPPRGFTEYARDVTNTSLKGLQNTIKKPTKQHQNNPETSPKNRDRDMTETSQRHRQNNTETRQRQDQERTETQPRQGRDITETRKHHRSTYGLQLHWFAQRRTIYKFKLEFEVFLKNPVKMFISVHHQEIKTQSPKQKNSTATSTTKHQAITHSSS